MTLHTSSAWFSFLRPRKQQAAQPIDADCVSKALGGDCSFYQCFNQRHPCNASSSNYAIDYGWKYCSRFDTHRNRLTEEGQRWLNGTRTCSMEKMLEYYRANAILCSEIETDMKEKHAVCEETNGLCRGSLIMDNKEVLVDVFTVSVNSGSHLLYSVEKCAVAHLGEAVSWLRDRFQSIQRAGRPILQAILPIVGDFENQAKKLVENFG